MSSKHKKPEINYKPDIKRIKRKLIFYASLIVVIVGSYFYGTFNPNWYVQEEIRSEEHMFSVKTAQALGLQEPEFQYTDEESFIQAVNKCVDFLNYTTMPEDRIPSGLIIAMAGIESGWGTSRFATEGNALFGLRTWDPKTPQIKPLDLPKARFGVKKYKTKCDSVRDAIRTLNTHHAYEAFRTERDRQYHDIDRDYDKLVPLIAPWSTNEAYSDIILSTIKNRNFK